MRITAATAGCAFIGTIIYQISFAGCLEYFKVQEQSFLLINQQTNQNDALRSCQQFGGQLLMILTQEIDDKVADMMTQNAISSLITSGKYNPVKSQWEWSISATPFVYENWGASSPGLKDYCCFKYSSIGYNWRGDLCTATANAFVCQLPIGALHNSSTLL